MSRASRDRSARRTGCALSNAKESFESALPSADENQQRAACERLSAGQTVHSDVTGKVVIAAITSCTNTSNPSVMLAAGLLAKKAVERGLQVPDWVKTSLAPGSKVVRDYLDNAGLMPYLEKLKFHVVGYGCTTCIGNSGPLPPEISEEIDRKNLVVASVLSGNRNFEGRINPDVRANYLMSPPLVVAFALAGRIDVDLRKDALGKDREGNPVYLADIWPTQREVDEVVQHSISSSMFVKSYADVFEGDEHWRSLEVPEGETYAWDASSTYIQRAPYFDEMSSKPAPVSDIRKARVLAVLGDSVTTDHISPAGSIKKDSPAGKYLQEHGVKPADFNSYGSRRGNHEVMVRGTFANVRLRNKMVPNLEGGFTRHLPGWRRDDRSSKRRRNILPMACRSSLSLARSTDPAHPAIGRPKARCCWECTRSSPRATSAFIAPILLAWAFCLCNSCADQSAESLGLTGEEVFEIGGIRDVVEKFSAGQRIKVRAKTGKESKEFEALVRIDTPQEALYYANGGILQYVLRQLLARIKPRDRCTPKARVSVWAGLRGTRERLATVRSFYSRAAIIKPCSHAPESPDSLHHSSLCPPEWHCCHGRRRPSHAWRKHH